MATAGRIDLAAPRSSLRTRLVLALAVVVGAALAGCGGGPPTPVPATVRPSAVPTRAPSTAPPTLPPSAAPTAISVRLQLQWLPQAQFAGYLAAIKQGYYTAEGLDLTVVPGGPDVVPQTAGSAPEGPEFTVAWVPKVLQARESERPSDLVNIAQVFQRSGTLSVSWKASNITSPKDFANKKVGVWDFGNEFEVTAAAKKYGLEPGKGFTKVIQPPDMGFLLSKQVDVAEAMVYNEYAELLETKDPATGALYKPTDLNVINYNDEGTAMLQDSLYARASWLVRPGNEDVAIRFLKASFEGWIYCRDHQADCVQDVLDAGSPPGAAHQAWQMNEVNALIWPSPNGIGMLDPTLWKQTVDIAVGAGIIREAPPAAAFRTDLATKALSDISDMDTKGASFEKSVVDVTEGGK